MRIVSQNRVFDLPYEQCGLQVMEEYQNRNLNRILNGYSIRAHFERDQSFRMADYSTEEKAKKAIELLHREWLAYKGNGLFFFPQDNEMEA